MHCEISVFNIHDGGVNAVTALGFDINLNAEIKHAVANAVGHEPQAAEFEVVFGERTRDIGIFVRPKDLIHLNVTA